MPPRANWKGYLKLSLVTCSVELFPATSEHTQILAFNLDCHMLPAPRINGMLHRVTFATLWESPQESGSRACAAAIRSQSAGQFRQRRRSEA
jgi:hypothetical protein